MFFKAFLFVWIASIISYNYSFSTKLQDVEERRRKEQNVDIGHRHATSKKGKCNPLIKACECPSQNFLSYEHLNLASIPEGIPYDTRGLSLKRNHLRNLSDTTFCQFPDLEWLELDFNNISHIGGNTFKCLPKLCMLSISRNDIPPAILEDAVFCGVSGTTVKFLNVSKACKPYVFNVSDSAMQCLRNTSIETLDTSYNTGMCELKNESFSGMWSLKRAFFTLMRCITFNTFALKNTNQLHELHLSRNELCMIPRFTNSNDTSLLPTLRILHLDHNKISFIGTEYFGGLSMLKVFNLGYNAIYFINQNLTEHLPYLTKLYLHCNRITRVWNNSILSDSLETISLYNNPFNLDKFPVHLFRETPKIKRIYMGEHYGRNQYVLENMFQNISTLKELSLESMEHMQEIPSNMFKGLYNLSVLSLKNNIITNVQSSYFIEITGLKSLTLSSNLLVNINSTSFPHRWKNTLALLDVAYNPWDCTCDLLYFVDWVQDKNKTNIKDKQNLVCASPPELKITKLIDLAMTADICLTMPISSGIKYAVAASIIMFITVTFLSALQRYRWKIKYKLFQITLWMMSGHDTEELAREEDYYFDVFVSYNKADSSRITKLLYNNLERKTDPPFRLCLSDRNWLVGHDTVDCIEESLEFSRKIVLVVTNAYARCQWCQLELTMAQHNLLEKDNDNVILAIMEDIDPLNMTPRLALEMKRKSYLEWTTDQIGQQLFWDKLKHCIRSPNKKMHMERPNNLPVGLFQ